MLYIPPDVTKWRGAKICAAETHLDNPPPKKPQSFAISVMFSFPTPKQDPLGCVWQITPSIQSKQAASHPSNKNHIKNVLNLAGLNPNPCHWK